MSLPSGPATSTGAPHAYDANSTLKLKITFEQDKIKKSHIDYKANTLVNTYKGAFGHEMSVEWQVSDNDVAFRYIIPSQNGGDTGAMVINEEATYIDSSY